jgi:hypothetical protein
MLRPPNLTRPEPEPEPEPQPPASAEEIYRAFASELSPPPRHQAAGTEGSSERLGSSSVFSKLASADSFTGTSRARLGPRGGDDDRTVHHLAVLVGRGGPSDGAIAWSPPCSSPIRSGRSDAPAQVPREAERMKSETLSRLAQPKRRSPARLHRASPRRFRAAGSERQVLLTETEEEIEVEVGSRVFLVDLATQLVFQIVPESAAGTEVGVWDAERRLVDFYASPHAGKRSPEQGEPKANAGGARTQQGSGGGTSRAPHRKAEASDDIVDRLLRCHAERERRLEETRLKEQQKRMAEELAECRPSPRLLRSPASSSGDRRVDSTALAKRCQAWAEEREARLDASRQQKKRDEARRWEELHPQPAHPQSQPELQPIRGVQDGHLGHATRKVPRNAAASAVPVRVGGQEANGDDDD